MPTINLTGGGGQPPDKGGGQTPKMTPEQRTAERAGRMAERDQRMRERAERVKGQIELIQEQAISSTRVFTERTVSRISYDTAKKKNALDLIAEKTLSAQRIIDAKKLVAVDLLGIRTEGAAKVANINAESRKRAANAQLGSATARAQASTESAAIRAKASTDNTTAKIAASEPIRREQLAQQELRTQMLQHRFEQQRKGGGRGGGGNGMVVGAIAGAAGGGFLGAGAGAAAGGLLKALPPAARITLEAVIGTALAAIELQFLPGQLMHKVLGAAQPAIDLTKSTFAAGRAGGFSGADLYKNLFPGTGTTEGTEWMGDLMLTPEKVMKSLGAYGIAQRSPGGAIDLEKAFGRSNLSAGLTGLGENVSEGIMRQGAGYGLAENTAKGANTYLLPFAGIMEQAVAAGMDRAKVLSNIQDSIDIVAKSGAAGISVPGIMDMFQRFAAAGTPGGRSGQSALDALSGQAGVLASPSDNPQTTFLLMSQLRKYGGLQTEEGIDQFLGEKNVAALNQSPAIKKRLYEDAIARAKNGSSYGALNLLMQEGMTANPDRLHELVEPAIKAAGIPKEYQVQAMANATGMKLPNAYESVVGQQNQGRMGVGDDRFTPNPFSRSGSSGYLQSDDNYRAALKANGVPDKYIEGFISAGKREGISPVLLAAVAAQETGGGDPSKINQAAESPGHDRGIMQISPPNQKAYFGAEGFGLSAQENQKAGANILAGDLSQAGGNLHEALGRYNAGGNFAGSAGQKYASSVEDIYGKMQSKLNVPTEIGKFENQASQATLAGADTALNRFVPVISKASDVLELFINSLSKSIQTLDAYDRSKLQQQGREESAPTSPRGVYTAPAPAPLLNMQ